MALPSTDHPHFHHHQRIQRKTKTVSYGIVPVATIVLVAWLYLRLFSCWDSKIGPGWLLFCRFSGLMAPIIMLIGLFIFCWLVVDLYSLGTEIDPSKGRVRRVAAGSNTAESKFSIYFALTVFLGLVLTIGAILTFGPFNHYLM